MNLYSITNELKCLLRGGGSMIAFWSCLWLGGCVKEQFPEYKPAPTVRTRTLSLIFLDKSDPSANVAIYLNNRLLSLGRFGSVRGLQQLAIADSLFSRTASLVLAEFEGTNPPQSLQVKNLIYETFILPSELSTVTTVAMTRDNAASPIVLSRSGISTTEAAPADGYFKIRFFNLTGSKLDVFRRNGKVFEEFANLEVTQERPYVELPFGPHRFIIRKQGGDGKLEDFSPVVKGEAGKVYNVLCTDEGQVITEVGDFGTPRESPGYIGIVNLLPGQPQVWAAPLTGGKRTTPVAKLYTRFEGAELVKAGNQSITIEAGKEKLTASYELRPSEYLMVYVVDRQGKPELQFVPTPLAEPGLDAVNARFLNFSSDTGKVSFSRLRTDVVLQGVAEPASINLSLPYATNLTFGEVRVTRYVNSANSVYTPYVVTRSSSEEVGSPLVIQAYRATSDPFRVGDPIAFARMNYPFFLTPPPQPVSAYRGTGGEPGTYSVILSGASGANPEERPKITVICHSF
jgi:hypothetical protein